MRRTMLRLLVMYLTFLIAFGKYSTAGACPAKDHPTFKVEIAPGLASEHGSGRLIVVRYAGLGDRSSQYATRGMGDPGRAQVGYPGIGYVPAGSCRIAA
jgi:hypothetical protein